MNVNGIGKQSYYEKVNGNKANTKSGGSGFYESLSENLNGKTEAESKKENTASAKGVPVTAAYPYCGASSKASASGVCKSEKINSGAVSEQKPRHISYQESDYVKVFAEQGYTLMAQVDVDSRKIYIERRLEDGTVTGYEADPDKLDKETTDPVERMALEAWEQTSADASETDGEKSLTVAEALLSFYEFIEDRIKNGPPKYMIGNSEFSVSEWDKLLEGIDGQIDAIREELRERIEKMKEEQLKAELSQETRGAQTDLRDAENEKIEEELLSSLFQDMSNFHDISKI